MGTWRRDERQPTDAIDENRCIYMTEQTGQLDPGTEEERPCFFFYKPDVSAKEQSMHAALHQPITARAFRIQIPLVFITTTANGTKTDR